MPNSLQPHGWIVCQAPVSMEFSRPEYWSEQPFPSLVDLPNPGIEPGSPALQADSSLSEPPGKLCTLEANTWNHVQFYYFASYSNNCNYFLISQHQIVSINCLIRKLRNLGLSLLPIPLPPPDVPSVFSTFSAYIDYLI